METTFKDKTIVVTGAGQGKFFELKKKSNF